VSFIIDVEHDVKLQQLLVVQTQHIVGSCKWYPTLYLLYLMVKL